jgi:Wiskott-Aldrich syndrome protein
MPTHFKLKFDDLTRRVSFAQQPSWQELAEKISTLYSIPAHQVGVTYIDTENEEITLNTAEELQDYYFSSYRPGDTIKFSVRDLTSRNERQPAPANAGFRNTFGQFVDPEIPDFDEWQAVNNIPSLEEILGHAPSTSDIRSAFVESVVSDGSTVGKGEDNALEAEPAVERACSEVSDPHISSEEKGKERAHSIRSISSTQSLLAADVGDKHPVHVYDVNSANNRSTLAHTFSFDDVGDPIAAESTPRVSTSFLAASPSDKKVDQTPELQAEDPPIPSLEFTDPQLTPQAADAGQSAQASTSLARDVASFLSAISDIISSHPELSESLRTIVRNTTNGTYWASHREALSQAAAELQHNTETIVEDGRHVVEEEAGRRVAEALSGVLRIFSQAQDGMQGETSNAQPSNPSTNSNTPQADTTNAPPSSDSNRQTTGPSNPEPPHPQTPPMPGAFSSTDFRPGFGGFPFGRRHTWRGGWRARASMPPNFGIGGGYPGWAMPTSNPPFGPGVLNATAPPGPSATRTTPFFDNNFPAASGPDFIPRPDHTNLETEGHERLSAQELRAKVEEAKRAYRAEKERYRREKEERRVEKDQEEKTQKVEKLA